MNRTAARRLDAIAGLIAPAVGERLYALARSVPRDHAILEIGSFKGKSSCYLGEGSRDGLGATVHCIEPWDLPGNTYGKHGYSAAAVRHAWHSHVVRQGLTGRVIAHQAFSHDFAQQWDGPIGLLFIDGSHDYADVRQDFEDYAHHLTAGALVVFDDYSKQNQGVRRYVDELRRTATHLSAWDTYTPPLAIARFR